MSSRASQDVYDCILGHGQAGQKRYYDSLRKLGIKPTPAEKPGSLFNPNPVVIESRLVETMMKDLRSFCQQRRQEVRLASDLLATMPLHLQGVFGGQEIAARLIEDLAQQDPFICLDAFLVASSDGLQPAYIEWQTFPAYPITALYCLEATRSAYPGIEENGGRFSPTPGESLEDLGQRMRSVFLRGIEDDPRQGVILDYLPHEQETSFEFDLSLRFTGGPDLGLGIIDPREVRVRDGQASYQRDGEWIPIRSVFSRLVHGDMERGLLPNLSADERASLTAFFNLSDGVHWHVHPLHFLYGTKGDLPEFQARGLSSYLPACERVTPALIERLKLAAIDPIMGRVQKPVEGNGGRDVIENPRLEDLRVGALLQDRIEAAPCHLTLFGAMTPEVRVMAIPDQQGGLFCSSVFTRVKAQSEFRSNAGAIARKGLPGTGEGYAVFVD